MAGQRKLLSEIDRTLKKVTEGVDVFNEIWDKVYSASAQNQKEKHEADLKKEIKKLQRFRDQIKNWIGNSDVKDKKPLVDARKLIEQKMEEFKVCEKETKTKAYSKEGLAQVERLDPAEQARQNTHGWIQECLSQFNEQIEALEVDLDKLLTAKGKNKNKAEKEHIESLIARHKWHMLKLEQINRLLDNDALEPTDVDELKDDIDYYLEANSEPGFLDNYDDDLYESLDLDTLGATMQVGLPTESDVGLDDAASSASNETAVSTSAPATTSGSSRGSKTPKKSVATTVIAGIGRPGAVKAVELKSTPAVVSTPVRTNSSKSVLTAATPNGKTDDAADSDKAKPRSTPTRAKPEPSTVASPKEPVAATTAKPASASSASSSNVSSPVVVVESPGAVTRRISPTPDRTSSVGLSQTPTSKPPVVPTTNSSSAPLPPVSTPSPQPTMSSLLSTPLASSSPLSVDEPPPLTEEQRQILRMIDESFMFIPDNHDSEKTSRYVPRNPYPAPMAFPSVPTTLFDNAGIFEKLDVDSLFFIFYYQQGSYQQYLAARELKRRTWGYHKKYKTWFKRHEEPQVTGDDYEQGTFVYFDYETGWCQRIKTEFTFEYSFLEDELQ
jgi:CCR4-NOT transcription complex subunit 3